MRLLHFADAHIDIANYGRQDPASGLPLRVLDFLRALDQIVETAIQEKVDLVLFAGDAYKDRAPSPTFQREWGSRIVRLSQARIPTLLLVGNHDLSPAFGRAHAVQEFDTLQVPYVRVLAKPQFLSSADLWDLPLQVIALPWITRSNLVALYDLHGEALLEVKTKLEERIHDLVQDWLERADPTLPTVLLAHASVQGATYGSERSIMLGNDLVLSQALVKDPRLDYVALGHIHKAQNLNEGGHPPVVYPGSIERVDFGEAEEEKYFVLAEVEKGKTRLEWRKIEGTRRFIDRFVRIDSNEKVMTAILEALPSEQMEEAIVRLTVEYPRELEPLIDEALIRRHCRQAFELHFIRKPIHPSRIRLPQDQSIAGLSPLDLLEQYWRSLHMEEEQIVALKTLALEVLSSEEDES
ncbi:MAG: exonuclease SbcCD subunit D [Anaerolineales bacterium]